MDAGYGHDARLRLGVTALGMRYVAGVRSDTLVFAPGHEPRAGHTRPKSGRRQRYVVSVADVARDLPAEAWRALTWREGSVGPLSGRFARARVVSAHRHRAPPERAAEWLLVEWPDDRPEPTRYWLSTLAQDIAFERLVDLTKLRWRIERDYQDLKQELGLDHFEGRSWRGFHHHASLCIAAYGFLISERGIIPPSGPETFKTSAQTAVSPRPRPRSAPATARTPCPRCDRHAATTPHRGPRADLATMPMLRRSPQTNTTSTLMTH